MKKIYKFICDKKVIYEVTEGVDSVTAKHIDALISLDDQCRRSQLRYIAPNLRDVFWKKEKNKWTPKYLENFRIKNKREPTKKEIDEAWRDAVTETYGILNYDQLIDNEGKNIDVSKTDILSCGYSEESAAVERLQEIVLDMPLLHKEIIYARYIERCTHKELAEKYNISISTVKRIIAKAVHTITADEELAKYIR